MTEKKEPNLQIYRMLDSAGITRAVKAKNKTAAILHVYAPLVETLKPSEIVELIESGVKVETAA